MSSPNALAQRVEVLEKQIALLLESNATEAKEPKKQKKEKKSKKDDSSDDEKPKKNRTSGYILFSNSMRHQVRDKLATDDENHKNTDIMKELGRLWKELSDEQKEPWNVKAKELKESDA